MKTIRNVGRDGQYPVTSVTHGGRSYDFPPGVDVELADDVADYVQFMAGASGLRILSWTDPRLFFSDGVTPLLTECTDFLDFDALRKVRAYLGAATHLIRGVKAGPGGGPPRLDVEPIEQIIHVVGPIPTAAETQEGDLPRAVTTLTDEELRSAIEAATGPAPGSGITTEKLRGIERSTEPELSALSPDEVSSPCTEPEVAASDEATPAPTLEDDVAKSIGISSEQLAGLEPPDPHKPHHKAKRK